MISKTAFMFIFATAIIWFFVAAFYTFKVVFKDYIEMIKSR